MDIMCVKRGDKYKNKMQNSALSIVIICILLSVFSLKAQTLRVAITDNDFPPYYFSSDAGLQGFTVEVLQAIANDIGATLSWQRLPWNRVLHHVAAGNADLISVIYVTDQRKAQFQFSEQSYLTEPIVLLCAQPCPLEYAGDLSALKQQELAVVRGFSYGHRIDSANLNTLALADSELQLIHLMVNGRINAALASAYSALYVLEGEKAGSKITMLRPALDHVDIYFAFSKASGVEAETIKKFNHALQRFTQSAAYTILLLKYELIFRD
jgi:polar amino acid transport system substrate-binding protein